MTCSRKPSLQVAPNDVQASPISILLLCLALAGCQTPRDAFSEPTLIGTVVATNGFPSVIRQNQSYIIDVQSRIYEGDIVRTNEMSRASIEMVDESVIDLGPDSHLIIHEYQLQDAETAPVARMTLASGSLKAEAHFDVDTRKPRFRIQTPLANIAVRGGSFWSGFIFGDNTLDAAVLDGKGLLVSNEHGSVEISRHGEGTTVIGGTAPQPPTPWSQLKLDRAIEETVIGAI